MGAEGYRSYYYPPKPCPDCGEMLPAGTAHLHYTRWEWFKEWLLSWWRQ